MPHNSNNVQSTQRAKRVPAATPASSSVRGAAHSQISIVFVLTAILFGIGLGHARADGQAIPGTEVAAAEKPGRPFKQRPTLTLADLQPLAPDPSPGPSADSPPPASATTGFFQVTQRDGRWWLVDPVGRLLIARGLNSVVPVPSPAGRQALARQFGTEAAWAGDTTEFLRRIGFNSLGAWSDNQLRKVDSPLPYTRIWNFMAAYGARRGGTYAKPGHTGYPGDCPFIFDPDFASFCDEHARVLAATKDDPLLIGHFADNELPWKRSLLEGYLQLPPSDHGYQAARAWLAARHGETAQPATITDQDQADFLEYAIDRYLAAVAPAIRRHDPNHLFLGMRLHGAALRLPEVWRACGRHCDVVSVNYYNAWTPNPERMAMWTTESGRPFLVTEFYVKAADSGLANTSGAGWLVETQADRGRFYQNFTLGLLASPGCVGWQWHRYADNDPDAKGADRSNVDSNKGIVSDRYQPWEPLVEAMAALNLRTAGLEARLRAEQSGQPRLPQPAPPARAPAGD